MGKKDSLVVGLDIGTTKICAVVGEVASGQVNVIGLGTFPSKGLRKGVVVNIESTVQSIKKAVEEAELMADCHITSVYAGIAGGHIKGINSHGVIAIKNKEITPSDVKRVIDAASAVAMPMDREIIHVIPQEFIVDEQDGIKDPVGMSGVRLEGRVHIVTGAITSAQNIIKCANRAGLDVDDIVLEQLGSSEAVLTQEEKELGAAIIDIGGGTTDLVIFSNGAIKHTAVFSLAGSHITNDISVGLRTPVEEAEKIKIRYGCALTSLVRKDETIEVPSVGGRKPRVLSRQTLAEIIEPRVEEILSLVRDELVKMGYGNLLASGVILTGGSAILDGVPDLAEQIFNLPVRRGTPMGVGGLVDLVSSPIYATGVGLVLYGNRG
ncbi:MAG: cell division protein FtsA, partial [Deltaproteobacteria bacterium]|nr:cell division protein FtsA [Deltaproteobacteria bacterium]